MSIKEQVKQAVLAKADDIADTLCNGYDIEIRKNGNGIKVLQVKKKTVNIPDK